MSEVVDCTQPEARASGVAVAAQAVRDGQVIVLPTDTVYGVGADAFDPAAVMAVLAAKGRDRDMPPPVLVPDRRTIDGLAVGVNEAARRLVGRYWPGPMTIILRSQPSLRWDLGETNGTVAVRMPDDEVALALLAQTGPLAVTSANRTGHAAATTVDEARDQLGEAVAVYLDGGPCSGGQPSTIIDCTRESPVVLREGAVPGVEALAVAAGDAAPGEGPGEVYTSPEVDDAAQREVVDPTADPGPDPSAERPV